MSVARSGRSATEDAPAAPTREGSAREWRFIRPFASLTLDDIPLVGGKNASFGEMIRTLAPLGVRVPDGFALTADAYRAVLDGPGVQRALREALARLDVADVESLRAAGAAARRAIGEAPLPDALVGEVGEAYSRVEVKPALEAILDAESTAGLIVIGSRGRGARQAGSLGSLSQRVVTAARRPVLVVH